MTITSALMGKSFTHQSAKPNSTISIIIPPRRRAQIYAWDFEALKNPLEDIGFRNCSRRDFDPALDSESRIRGTLYVDCVSAIVSGGKRRGPGITFLWSTGV